MNKLMLMIIFSSLLLSCEQEEAQSRELGKQASEQVKQMEKQINKVAQDHLEQYKKIDELTQ